MVKQTRLFGVVVALFVCFATSFATTSIIVANFEETTAKRVNSTEKGTLYYYYDDSANGVNSRLLYEYTIGKQKVSNLYHYKDSAIYSMCSDSCTALSITEGPDPWYYNSNVYTKGSAEGTYTWFVRKAVAAGAKTGPQVSRILMGTSTTPSAQISKIELADGRVLKLTNVRLNPSGYSSTHAKFAVDASLNCPKPTCPIYADIVFVLDNSDSVDSTEWTQTVDFVNAVMDSFTFGSDAVEAAIIQYNAPGWYSPACTQDKKQPDGCYECTQDYSFASATYPGYATANIIAGYSDSTTQMTVSPFRDTLKSALKSGRPENYCCTCQGYGLQLATTVFSRSPRNQFTRKPDRIVIAVTDGYDMCFNTTYKYADKLKSEYGAFLIEIGVGLPQKCTQNFLKRLASKVGDTTTAAYYDVSDYSAIKDVTEKLFKPICDGYNTQCGPDCLGFCGCGKCLCPTCDKTGTSCFDNKCTASSDGKSSTGCGWAYKDCPIKDDVCTQYKCDGTKTDENERCYAVQNPCTDLNKKYQEECRVVKCDPTKTGGCYVYYDDNYCQTKFGNACEQYKCARDNEVMTDKKSGCILYNNKTKTEEERLKKLSYLGGEVCFTATCDKVTGVVGNASNCQNGFPKCYTKTCELSSGKYQCVERNKNKPTDTKCATYSCSQDPSVGWYISSKEDTTSCTEKFEKDEENSTKCHDVYCDPDTGCEKKHIDGCNFKCEADFINDCIAEGARNSDSTHCKLGSCKAVKIVGENDLWDLSCDFSDEKNCHETMASTIAELNAADHTMCYTPACGADGRCTYTTVDVPEEMVTTQCMHPVCTKQEDGSWDWEYVETELSLSCVSDDCSTRVCDPEHGCNVTDICTIKSNQCVTYECVITDNGPKCNDTPAIFEETQCTKEVCQEGKKVFVLKDLEEACPNENKCKVPKCVDGQCDWDDKEPETVDICKIYTCNPDSGEFTVEDKCDDHLACTIDECTVFGECKHSPLSCEGKIDMEDYPCFEPKCKEGKNGAYKCVRKLLPNAYIDMCGECITEKSEEAQTQTGTEESITSSAVAPVTENSKQDAALDCTNAPPKPVLTEGLAAATIALIVLAAVLIGCGITASSIMGTKTLIDRAKGAKNQSAHTNPLFEEDEAEMTNPAFVENQDN